MFRARSVYEIMPANTDIIVYCKDEMAHDQNWKYLKAFIRKLNSMFFGFNIKLNFDVLCLPSLNDIFEQVGQGKLYATWSVPFKSC